MKFSEFNRNLTKEFLVSSTLSREHKILFAFTGKSESRHSSHNNES